MLYEVITLLQRRDAGFGTVVATDLDRAQLLTALRELRR